MYFLWYQKMIITLLFQFVKMIMVYSFDLYYSHELMEGIYFWITISK